MTQNREGDKIRGQMAVLERRVQVSVYIYYRIFYRQIFYVLLIHKTVGMSWLMLIIVRIKSTYK